MYETISVCILQDKSLGLSLRCGDGGHDALMMPFGATWTRPDTASSSETEACPLRYRERRERKNVNGGAAV